MRVRISSLHFAKSRYLSIDHLQDEQCRQDLDHVVTDILFHLAAGQGFFVADCWMWRISWNLSAIYGYTLLFSALLP